MHHFFNHKNFALISYNFGISPKRPIFDILMHMAGVTRGKIEEVVKKIVQEFEPEKIILFGSYAWGTPTNESDVDLLIIKEGNERRIEREQALRGKLFPSGIPLDVLIYTPDEVKKRLELGDFFIEDIVKKGKVVYDHARQTEQSLS